MSDWSVVRSPRWKQENPRDQMVVVFQSIEGDFENLVAAVERGSVNRLDLLTQVVKMRSEIGQLWTMIRAVSPGEWKAKNE